MISTIIRVATAYLAATAGAAGVAVGTLLIMAYPNAQKALSSSQQFDSAIETFLFGWFLIAVAALVPFLLLNLALHVSKSRSRLATLLVSAVSGELVLQSVLTLAANGRGSRYDVLLNLVATLAGTIAGLIFWNVAVKVRSSASVDVGGSAKLSNTTSLTGNRSLSILIGGSVLAIGWFGYEKLSAKPPGECSVDIRAQSDLLRVRIADVYAARAVEIDKSGPNGTDITASISDVLSNGMTFNQAEAVLRCSGFKVQPRPGPSAAGVREDRFDVYAEVLSLLPQVWYGNRKIIALLRPKSPNDYAIVERITVVILATFL